MHRAIVTFVLLTVFNGISYAAPVITDITGNLSDGESVVLTGAGFGSQGPTIHIYDNFDIGGIAGDDVDLTAVVGAWFGYGTNKPTYDEVSYSGDFSIRINKGIRNGGFSHVKAAFPPATEVFISYWLQVPEGTTFPGADIPGIIPTTSTVTGGTGTWKPVWMFDGDNNETDNDVIFPNYANGDFFLFGNNTLRIGGTVRMTFPTDNPSQTDSIFRFGKWIRITAWLQGGDDPDPSRVNTPLPGPPPTGPGKSKWTFDIPSSDLSKPPFGGTTSGYPRIIQSDTAPVFTYVHPATVNDANPLGVPKPPYQWTHINVGGWAGNGALDWSLTRPVIDDFYMATGSGAQARIEICEAPQYGDCEKFGYITVSSAANWNDTAITGVIRRGALSNAEVERAFAYVYDKDGLVNTTGFPLCPKCPLPPTNLQAE